MILRPRSVYVQWICRRSVQLFDQSFLLIVLSSVVDQSSTSLFFFRCSIVPCAVRFVVSARWHNVLFLNDDWRGTNHLMKNWLGGSGTIAGVSSGDFPVAWLFVTTSSANDTRFVFTILLYDDKCLTVLYSLST